MEFQFPMPIMIKEEVMSDEEEVHCRLCHKAFASPVALRNHVRMDHIEVYQLGDPTAWTKASGDPVVKTKVLKKEISRVSIKNREKDIISAMQPTSITSLACNNVSYIIIKSEDLGQQKPKKTVKKEVSPKKKTATEAITGPFECLEPSTLGADGLCHQIFFSCCLYSAHTRQEHSQRRRTPRCVVCERALPTRPEDSAAPYGCESCGDGFQTSDELQDHMSIAHVKQKPYECSICNKRFTQQGGVLQHMRMHTGDRPFPCTFCSKAFTQKSGLEQHIRTHTRVKPYRCVVCTKSFIQSVHLKQHMRTHTNVAPFQCGVCLKRFKQSSHLNYHLKNHSVTGMTRDQRDTYNKLVEQVQQEMTVPDSCDGLELVYPEMSENELIIAEQSIVDDNDTYITVGYGDSEDNLAAQLISEE